MNEFDERISKAYDLIERYGRSESDIHYETGLDADDCFRDLMVYVKGLVARIAELEKDLSNKEIEYTDLWDDALALQARIAELEAENEKINYFFRRLRMFCIFAHWDNPNTEAEFYNVDAEIREYLSEYKVCIDQLTAHTDIERQDDKWIPEVQE